MKKKRFDPDDKVIFTNVLGDKMKVNFRGYSNAQETKAVIAGKNVGGQMEVDVEQLK